MNKIFGIFTFCVLGIVSSVGAVTMCLRDDSFVVMLLRDRDGTSVETSENKNFQVNFDYYTSTKNKKYVRGMGTCNDVAGTVNVVDKELDTDNETAIAATGVNCWCRMTSPLSGYFVYAMEYDDDTACASGCAQKCADNVQIDVTFRTAFYEGSW